MQKYCIVHFIEPLPDDHTFVAKNNWPLHITLISNFAVDLTDALRQQITGILSSTRSLSVVAAEEAYFGLQQQVHVSLMQMTPELKELHNRLMDLLESAEAVFDEPQHHREGYRAHATIQLSSRLHQGDEILIDNATLVDMFPDGDITRRRVLSTTQFSAN